METVINIAKVTKLYGNAIGVQNVTLQVPKGSVFGFLGPNGAGKTTLISMLVDLIRPTAGSIEVFGMDTTKDGVKIRQKIGFLAGDISFDESLKGIQQLEYFASLRGGVTKKEITGLAKRLNCRLDKKISSLSRGNKQKIGLIAALMHNPELLILDEPTNGLDPIMQEEFNSMIAEHQAGGGTTFISSHVLSEVQEICDQVAFIKEGKLIAVEKMVDIVTGAPKQVKISADKPAGLKFSLTKLSGLKIGSVSDGQIEATYDGDINKLMKLLANQKLSDVTVVDADLETIFMQHYGEKSRVK